MKRKLSREELAALEVGHTTISNSLSKAMVSCFILLIVAVPVAQGVLDWKKLGVPFLFTSLQTLISGDQIRKEPNRSLVSRVKYSNNKLLERMDTFERQLEERSILREQLLAPGQRLLLAMGYGNEKVYPGIDNWLFYRPDMDYLMGPSFLDKGRLKQRREGGKTWETSVQPDPVPAIVEFHKQLAQRGIQLILMPTPIKASLHPEFFKEGSYDLPVHNKSWKDFLITMEHEDILLFDPSLVLIRHLQETQAPLYLRTDTHWRPDAMEAVAKELADFIKRHVGLEGNATSLARKERTLTNQGDIDAMLRIPEEWELFEKEEVTIHQIVTHDEELWQPAPDAEVFLLGDSFSNIYSLSGMGWGEGAGLGEHLSYSLQKSVDVILQNDAGAYATRGILSRELSRGRDRLAGKKVLIWQFACRELSSGDWKHIPMDLKESVASDFFTPRPGEEKNVTAIVAGVSRSPVPGSVPYKDNIVTLHLVDIHDKETGQDYGQALVYGWGMQENKLNQLSKVRIGEQIDITLLDWDTVEGEYSSYRRSTLDDEMLELELPVWGEIRP